MRQALYFGEERMFDGFMKMACDEVVTQHAVRLGVPILRFYSFLQPAVSIGFFQEINQEVSVDLCDADNIPIFRRKTGGGAVYKYPPGEINYSFSCPGDFIQGDILRSHEVINAALIRGLGMLGYSCVHTGINDISLAGKKISGNAQTRFSGGILQHGTLLLDFDAVAMRRYLSIPVEKMKKVVGTLYEHKYYDKETIIAHIIKGFEEEFSLSFQFSEFPSSLIEDALVVLPSYASRDWVFRR